MFGAVVVLLAATGLAGLSVGSVRRSFPTQDGQLTVPGLTGRVEVLRDANGVAHLYADGAEDLFEAQGYVQAQDRFYEMDIRRHITAGRLSELFGAAQVETDTYLRTLGWRRVAEAELGLLSAEARRYLDAYAAGVNSYLAGRSSAGLSLEYNLLALQGLDYTPERWTAVDSLAWLKAMAWDLGSNLSQETELAIMARRVGSSRAAELFPGYPLADFDPIVTRGTVVNGAFAPGATGGRNRPVPGGPSGSGGPVRGRTIDDSTTGRVGELLRPWLEPRTAIGETGSNSWVVAGRLTSTGRPLLSNDPHLATAIPSVFQQVGLHCRTVSARCPFDVAGFSLAGVPGIVIGHNATIAWGLTTSYLDQQDLYVEDVSGDSVLTGDRRLPLTVRTEELRVRGEDQPRMIKVRASPRGPLLSDVDPQVRRAGEAATPPDRPPYAVALRWTALTPGRTMDGLFDLAVAGNFEQFRAAAAQVSDPSQNLIYADTAGHIGYQLAGTIPRRGRGTGVVPSPGWDAAYEWKGTVPPAEAPFVFDPPAGYIVAANQQIIGPQYPYRLGSTYSYGWRSQQLIDRIAGSAAITPELAAELFYDDTVRFAAELVPPLLKIRVDDPWIGEGQRTLVGWDYRAGTESAAAAYFHVVMHDILKLTFRDEMPEDLWPTGGDRWFAVLSELLQQPSNPWWDDTTTADVRERRDDILLAAMISARKELTSLMARDTDRWQWGRIHTITLRHQTLGRSGIGPVERIFNRGDYPAPGGSAVVNALGYDTAEGYAVTYGPAMRMLVDLSDLDRSLWINQSGNSGHAYHPNYDDQLPLWATNRLLPFVFSRPAVEAATEHRLELVPAG